MIKRKKIYIEALRILAIFLVLFQHVPAFDYYLQDTSHVMGHLFFTLIAKINVPLFLMISGSLLLNREEGYREIFRKRMIKIILAILIFNFLVYLAENQFVFDLQDYCLGVFENGIDRSYWYLYSYLGFLVMMPLLHRIAQKMTKNDFILILFIHFVFSTIEPLLQWFVPTYLGQSFEFTWAFRIPFSTIKEIFYPLMGYYIDRKIHIESIHKRTLAGLGCLSLLGILISMFFTIWIGNQEGFSDEYLELFDYVSALSAFILIKSFFVHYEAVIPAWISQKIVLLGSVTYGVYLWDPFFRKLFFDGFDQTMIPWVGGFFSSVLWCICSFLVCGILVQFLKRIPKVKSLF